MTMLSTLARHTAGVRCGDSVPAGRNPGTSGGFGSTAGTCPSGAPPPGAQFVNPPDAENVAAQFAFDELGRLSFAEHSLESVLQRVTALAAQVLPGEPVTSVTIIDRGRPATVASSGDLALRLDEVQYDLGSGPCLAAAADGQQSELVDPRAPPAWPESAARAVEQGCGSVLSFPLPVQELVHGALNVYSRRFTVPDRRTLDLVARFA